MKDLISDLNNQLRALREEELVALTSGFSNPDLKSLNQLVTDMDLRIENKLVAICKSLLPESSFLTEEKTVEQSLSNYQWIIDPIDGTTNFIHQIPAFAFSIALQEKGETVLGIVYEITRNELFYAVKGEGAFMNDKPIHVAKHTQLSDCLLATGFPYYDFGQMDEYLEVLKVFMKGTRGLRRIGSAAVDLAYTACGRFDGFFEYGLSPWDIAAGAFIVQEAGGKVCDFNNGNDYIFGKEIIAAQPEIFNEFQQIIQNAFKK